MDLIEKAVAFIAKFEGLRLEAYEDVVGVWTIGYGTTVLPNGAKVCEGMSCSEIEAKAYLIRHVRDLNEKLSAMLLVPLNDNQRIALLSLVYNIGVGAFQKSTLLKQLNSKTSPQLVAFEFLKWNKAGGRVIDGLVTRRNEEMKVFLT